MSLPITSELVYELTGYASPTISPDGGLAAYAKSNVDRDTMKTCSVIMLVDTASGDSRQFTAGPKDAAPKFSPDGQTLAFLRPNDDGKAQVWTIGMDGGEAQRVTAADSGVAEFAWSPSSDAIVYGSDVDPNAADADDDSDIPKVRVVNRITYRADTLGWRGDAYRQLFVHRLCAADAIQITDGDWDSGSPRWSPDGKRIAFVSARRPDREMVSYNEVYDIAADGSGETELRSSGLSSVGALAWTADGSALVIIGSDDDEIGAAWQGRIFILERGAAPQAISDDSVRPVSGFPPNMPSPELKPTADGRALFMGDSEGQSYICVVSPNDAAPQRLTAGGMQIAEMAMDASGNSAVINAASPNSPGDIQLVDIASGAVRCLTSDNDDWLATHLPATLRKRRLTRVGMTIESRLLLPPDFDSDRRYPMILNVHGGPHGSFYDAFNPTEQTLATAGYVVLSVNPRGSSTYGAAFLKAVLRDWGEEDYRDIMAAVEEVCAEPFIDTDRLGVHGYSYGGYMSSWIVGHNKLFRAAVVGAPCIDLLSMYGTSDIGVSFGERQWGGSRHEAVEWYLEHSPITYAPEVEAPVLLLHGEADHRCPIEQSEQYFVSLRRLGKTVELARFEGCSHLFVRGGHPKMREEYLRRTFDWFERWLAPTE